MPNPYMTRSCSQFKFVSKTISVKVKPNARQQSVFEEPDGSLTVQLKSPPIDGKANQELIQLLAKTFGVPKSAIQIKSGATSKLKRVTIALD